MKIGLKPGSATSIALETNGKGFIGFLVELPGAFVRGRNETEALSKVPREVECYLQWLEEPFFPPSRVQVVERHFCELAVEDADSEILLSADRDSLDREEFERLVEIARQSGRTFVSLYDQCRLRNWTDPARDRGTFYGGTPKTIQEVFDHVMNTQRYYVSRIGLPAPLKGAFLDVRESCMEGIAEAFRDNGNAKTYYVDGESWTIKKVLRRFIWHDRIHGKAIMRILVKQKRLGLIDSYEDSFRFGIR